MLFLAEFHLLEVSNTKKVCLIDIGGIYINCNFHLFRLANNVKDIIHDDKKKSTMHRE